MSEITINNDSVREYYKFSFSRTVIMFKALSPLLGLTLFIGFFLAHDNTSLAQVTSDGTVDTQVNQNGNVAEITGGARRGDNLFHSFQDFSVPTNNEAIFNNANTIENIFSRVTGGNISNIDGVIRANGSASLFLINPAGIIFGENARLDLGGSFYGSSASSILFEDGEFSATDLENPPLLTINAPIGLGFRDNPGNIVNRADFGLTEETLQQEDNTVNRITSRTGLEVNPSQNLALIGGNVTLTGSGITAPGGNVTLGGLSQGGTVAISPDSIFSFPENAAKADLSLENNALVSVIGNGGGAIDIDVSNLTLSQQSQLRAGIAEGSGDSNTVAGDIVINASESVTLIGNGEFEDGDRRIDLDTAILNTVGLSPARIENFDNENVGNTAGSSGSIAIDTKQLNITKRSVISTLLYGVGNAGDIDIDADTVTLDEATITSQVGLKGDKGRGNSGDININSKNFTATNLTFVVTDNRGTGVGNAGDINLNATDSVVIEDRDKQFTAFISETEAGTVGSAGDINLTASSIKLNNSIELLTQVSGEGNTGSIEIEVADSLVISGGAAIKAQVIEGGEGTAGNININANTLFASNGIVISQIKDSGVGNAGNIEIDTNTLELLENSLILADSRSLGNSGDIVIRAKESVFVNGSIIATGTIKKAQGSSGRIEIISPQVSLTDKAIISSSAEGRGDTGDINIDTETIFLDNFSLITASSRSEVSRISGNININADRLTLQNGSIINATTSSRFDGGQIDINSQVLELLGGGVLQTATDGNGDAGDIFLNVSNGIVLNGNNVPAKPPGFTFDEPVLDNLAGKTGIFANVNEDTLSSGGNIFIDSGFIIAFPNGNSDIIANARRGQGGNITIDAELLGIKPRSRDASTNDINASSEVSGLDGNIVIRSLDSDLVQKPGELRNNFVEIEQTTAQVCQTNREAAAKNVFTIEGRGGIRPIPDAPLDSQNIFIGEDLAKSQPVSPPTLKTARGTIQPARGIAVTESGVILTAYRTNNAGDRLPEIETSCD